MVVKWFNQHDQDNQIPYSILNMQRLSKPEKKQLKIKYHQEIRKEKRKRSHLNKKLKRNAFVAGLSEEDRERFYKEEQENLALIDQESQRASESGIPLVFDFSYCSKMTSVEIGSLQSQISDSVGFLRKQNPQYFSLICSNVPSELTEKLSKRGSKKWHLQVHEDDLASLAKVQNKTIVYLSPEGDEPLLSIDESSVYVIGGLVDRTIQSSLSYSRGQSLGVQTKRLPIAEHGSSIIKPERRVFNINTVIAFLHHLASGKSCEEAFLLSIPKRWTLQSAD